MEIDHIVVEYRPRLSFRALEMCLLRLSSVRSEINTGAGIIAGHVMGRKCGPGRAGPRFLKM